ncbi:MAG TPA: hypothetical protein ENI77_05445 [Nitrospirae bacterium]|nr:hypothetical protein [Nitrospirota bacterium]
MGTDKKTGKQEWDGQTGILLIAHGNLADGMLVVLEFITGPQPRCKALALDHALEVEKARNIVAVAIDDMMSDKGVLVLTDLFGGAPSNIAMSILDEKYIEIVAGVNLPILIHATGLDESLSLKEKAEKLREYGQDNIFVASEVLSGDKK